MFGKCANFGEWYVLTVCEMENVDVDGREFYTYLNDIYHFHLVFDVFFMNI